MKLSTRSIFVSLTLLLLVITGYFYFINTRRHNTVLMTFKTNAVVREDSPRLETTYGRSHQLPKCLIIGVRKGGSLALLQLINVHPDIVTPRETELHFFDKDERYEQGLTFYKNKWPKIYKTQIPIEKTPAYFHEWKVPQRVYNMNSSIKLLLLVRNPVTRIVSEFAMNKVRNKNKYRNRTLKSLVLDHEGNVQQNCTMVNISTYHAHFSEWLKYFPREQIHLVDADKFAKQPLEELHAIESFLGIRHALTNKNIVFDEDKGFFCPVGKNNNTRCLRSGKGRKHPEVEPEVLEKLNNYFKPLNARFFAISGRTFHWD